MQITEKQLALVNDRLQAILRSDNYFAKLYKERGITEVKTVEDFKAATNGVLKTKLK